MSDLSEWRARVVRALAIASVGPWVVLIERVVTPQPCNPFAAHCTIAAFPELDLAFAVVLGVVALILSGVVRAAYSLGTGNGLGGGS